jgi:transposase
VPNAVVVPVIWYVLSTGVRWQDVLPSMGCSGRTAHRRLQYWQEIGIWEALHMRLLELLNRDGKLDLDIGVIDSTMVPAPGGGARVRAYQTLFSIRTSTRKSGL